MLYYILKSPCIKLKVFLHKSAAMLAEHFQSNTILVKSNLSFKMSKAFTVWVPWEYLTACSNLDNLLIRCHQHLLSMYILSLLEGTGVFTHINSHSACLHDSLNICNTDLNWGKWGRHVQNCFVLVWDRATTPSNQLIYCAQHIEEKKCE